MPLFVALIVVLVSSTFCKVFVVWPNYGLDWLHLPQWTGLALLGLLLSWLIGE